MRKGFVLAFICWLAFPLGFSQTLSLRLGGGLGYGTGGDLAKGLRGQRDYYAAEYDNLTGEFKLPKFGWAAGGEILVHLKPSLALGLGAGFERHGIKSLVGYAIGVVEVEENLKPAFDVIPLTGSLHLFLALGPKLKLDLSAGGGAYITRLNWDFGYDIALLGYQGSDVYTFRSSKVGFGFQGGVGLEMALSSKLSLVLNVLGRVAKIGPFLGDWTETGTGDFWSFADNGGDHVMYYYDWTLAGKTYPQIVFQSGPPAGTSVSNAREAKLDLTGFTASFGIKIALF